MNRALIFLALLASVALAQVTSYPNLTPPAGPPYYLTFPEVAVPGSPAADYLALFAVADTDFVVLETIDENGVRRRINQDTYRIARNTTVSSIAAAKAVYFTGSTGNKPNFALAKANAEATMPAIGMTTATVAANNYGQIMIVGRLSGVKTNYAGWTEGDQLYVDPSTAGELTNVRPTHPSLAQWMGTIEVVHATQGVILVNTQALTGVESGTNRNTYTIGDAGAGVKSVAFDGTNDASLQWNSTTPGWTMTSLPTGIVKSTSGALSAAVAADLPIIAFQTADLGYYMPFGPIYGFSSDAIHATTDAKFFQFVLTGRMTFSKIAYVSYTGGTGYIVVGVYDTASRLAQARRQDPVSTTYNVDTLDTPITIGPGVYYVAWGCDFAGCAIGMNSQLWPTSVVGNFLNSGTLKRFGYGGTLTGSGATLSLPATVPTITAASTAPPGVVFLP